MSNFRDDEGSKLIINSDISLANLKNINASSSADLFTLFGLSWNGRRRRRRRSCLPLVQERNGIIIFYYYDNNDCEFRWVINTNSCEVNAEYKKVWQEEVMVWSKAFEKTSITPDLYSRLLKNPWDSTKHTWSDEEELWLRILRTKFWISLRYTAMFFGRTLISVKRKSIYIEYATWEIV